MAGSPEEQNTNLAKTSFAVRVMHSPPQSEEESPLQRLKSQPSEVQLVDEHLTQNPSNVRIETEVDGHSTPTTFHDHSQLGGSAVSSHNPQVVVEKVKNSEKTKIKIEKKKSGSLRKEQHLNV